MRSLLVRIFLSFWSIIVITIVSAATLGYFYAERVRASIESFEVSDAMVEAGASLQQGGREGLADWLESLPGHTASRMFILDEREDDILGRKLPPPIEVALRRMSRRPDLQAVPMREAGNRRPERPFTQLTGPDDHVYTIFVLPPQGAVGRWLVHRGGLTVIVVGLLVSAAISYLLARAISRPIRRFRESAVAIAGGNLDTRVADHVGGRRDEIGLLAEDFDRMTKQLQRAWQRQTELTQNVSHELRSPLARLRVALELARRKTGDLPELDKIDLETERLDELIGQILEFSRLDADPHEQRSSIDLGELAESVVEDVRYEYGEDASIVFEPGSSSVVMGYPKALRGALENILRNAMQHSRSKGQVRIGLREESGDVMISVADEGGGVAEGDLDSIFEPFYRSSRSDGQPASHGTGLGLAIAKRAIELNAGSIVATNVGNGLSIEIRLPASRQ